MPALDQYDVVHELTKKVSHLEHCHNNRAKKEPGYWCQDGWHEHRPITEGGSPPLRTPRWVWVPGSDTVGQCMAQSGGHKIKTCEGCDECR